MRATQEPRVLLNLAHGLLEVESALRPRAGGSYCRGWLSEADMSRTKSREAGRARCHGGGRGNSRLPTLAAAALCSRLKKDRTS
jgi:hypothetical protein